MTSTPKSVLREDRRGQAAVEALLVVMLMAILIFGGVELARGVAIRQALIPARARRCGLSVWTPRAGITPVT